VNFNGEAHFRHRCIIQQKGAQAPFLSLCSGSFALVKTWQCYLPSLATAGSDSLRTLLK